MNVDWRHHFCVMESYCAVQEERDRQIAEVNAQLQKLTERLEQREQELVNSVEDLRTQLQVIGCMDFLFCYVLSIETPCKWLLE